MGCLLFNGMFALHIQLPRHLVTVICEEIVIERFVVACNRASDTGGMSCKDGAYFR